MLACGLGLRHSSRVSRPIQNLAALDDHAAGRSTLGVLQTQRADSLCAVRARILKRDPFTPSASHESDSTVSHPNNSRTKCFT